MRVAIVGATGLVGQTLLRILDERRFPVAELRLYASADSRGSDVVWRGQRCAIQTLEEGHGSAGAPLAGIDVAFFAAGAEVSRRHARTVAGAGAIVIDKSTAMRLEPDVPLIVPEINGELIGEKRLIANPNCATIPLALLLAPVAQAFGVKWASVSTYQSVSGAGRRALEELAEQSRGFGGAPAALPRRIAGNVFPENGAFDEAGHSDEEQKIAAELRKLLDLPELAVSATSVRVPVAIGHGEAVAFGTTVDASLDEIRSVLRGFSGIVFAEGTRYAAPADVAGTDDVVVGRLRRDNAHPRAYLCWVASDNLRKGAATNAVQIAEYALRVRATAAS
ncbi:MAG: aspartate-semialdehyde dehydrogenase [Candidatus Eremiobacteraeota bacterium]|nr:aspartate-semialdehyde dehydrogenase [Candidatus Eremiobacteraeota bacterium]MBC5827728.1 aspartate-semialdehyde dehydrogenase [Candidatus Eremiobacteraeota bacterium]